MPQSQVRPDSTDRLLLPGGYFLQHDLRKASAGPKESRRREHQSPRRTRQRAKNSAENKVIEAKDLEGTRPKKRTDKPSNFVSYKDFNPGSWLRLKSLPDEDNNFWLEMFQRELKDSEDPNAIMGKRQPTPGVLLFRG